MNYLQKSRARNHYKKLGLFLAVLFIFGALFFYFLGGYVISAVSPVWRAENALTNSLSGVGNFFSSRQTLIKENARLEERLASLELELASRSALPGEEGALMELAGRRADSGGIAATALASPPQTPYDVIVIDAGSRDGINPGEQVYLPEGPLLGIVSEVLSSSAKVILFSSPGEKTNAVLERHNLPVVLEGVGGGNFKIIVPRETPVEVGDRVLSADISSSLIAVVGEVNLEPTDSFKDILAKSPVNVFAIRYVLIRP